MKALSYQDIYLVYNRPSQVKSRRDVNVKVDFLGKTFNLPVVPANMSDVIDARIAFELSQADFFYIYHRFGKDTTGVNLDICSFVEQANLNQWKIISISVGMDEIDVLEWSKSNGYKIDFITFDIAHAYNINVPSVLEKIKRIYPEAKLIAGNIMTAGAAQFLEVAGADAVKIGISGGAACSTKNKTGFHYPMFSCIKEILPYTNLPIIADGGIREIGDIAKAINAGADMVMCGALFAACSNSPAPLDQYKNKLYRGSASELHKNTGYIEGFSTSLVPRKTIFETLNDIKEGLQSAVSYAGGDGSNVYDIGWADYVEINK